MNIQHKDIKKFIPYGEMLRGYANQNVISKADLRKNCDVLGVEGKYLND